VEEIRRIGLAIATGLAYLHSEHSLLHGDVKSANVLLSRDLERICICDLGVSIPLKPDLSGSLQPLATYEGTEPWRPPETLIRGDGILDLGRASGSFGICRLEEREGNTTAAGNCANLRLCDRTDVFAFGLVIWEMLTGEVPHAAQLVHGNEAYRAALGSRPPLPNAVPIDYQRLARIFWCCTHHEPDRRPSASELVHWFEPASDGGPPHDA